MPDWSEDLRPRLALLRLSPSREADIIEELSQHLDLRYEELLDGGAPDVEARRLARPRTARRGSIRWRHFDPTSPAGRCSDQRRAGGFNAVDGGTSPCMRKYVVMVP